MTSRSALLTILFVVAAVAARIAVATATFEPGRSALTWDDFTRVAIARQWAESPFLVDTLVWLPLPFWVTGAVYAVAGSAFAGSPMALMAAINTAAVIAAALVTGWSGWRLAGSRAGGIVAFLAILFSPWGLFTGNSGLAEPLYYLAIAFTAAGAVAWVQRRHHGALAVGSLAVAASAAMRYEGWWLAAAWVAWIAVDGWWRHRHRGRTGALRAAGPAVAVGAVPLLVPVWWMWVNLHSTGSALYFARESASTFLGAYGADLFDSVPERVLYYPAALFRAAPLLLIAIAATAIVARRRPEVRGLLLLFTAQLAMFYATSLVSPAVGAFAERFMFAFAIGLAPILGAAPDALRRLAASWRPAATAAAILLAAASTVVRAADPPQEWTHAPDLLAITEALGTVPQPRFEVVAGPGMENDLVPLSVRNGSMVALTTSAAEPDTAGVWLERLPSRVAEFPPSHPQVGRFAIYGSLAEDLTVAPCPGCDGWSYQAESGARRAVRAEAYLGLEFTGDDPAPGSRASLVKAIAGSTEARTGKLDLRWLYGHGFNSGRIDVEVTVASEVVFAADISSHSRWTEVDFDLPAGPDPVELRVSVVAQPGIEAGWAWGRASTVLIRSFEVGT